MSETSKTAKIILVLYWGLRHNRIHIRSMVQYSTKMIFAVLDVSLMGLNIGETDKVFFYINDIQRLSKGRFHGRPKCDCRN